jgi:hypothetical protein
MTKQTTKIKIRKYVSIPKDNSKYEYPMEAAILLLSSRTLHK